MAQNTSSNKLNMVTMNAAFQELLAEYNALKDQVAEHESQTAFRIVNLEHDVEHLEKKNAELIEATNALIGFRDYVWARMKQNQTTQQQPPFKPTHQTTLAAPEKQQQPSAQHPAKLQQPDNAVTSLAQYAQYKARVRQVAMETGKTVDVISYASAAHMPYETLIASIKPSQ